MESNNFIDLTPSELIRWCKKRKNEIGLSNLKLSELSNVPIGTIDRLMSGNYCEYKYSSIQPILSILIGYNEQTPLPDINDKKQNDFYYQTIEGYKLIVENKNRIIEGLKKEIEFLRSENLSKESRLEKMYTHLAWLENLVDKIGFKGNINEKDSK